MVQSNVGGKYVGRKRDRLKRWLGIHPPNSPSVGSDPTTNMTTIASSSEAARSSPLTGRNSAAQSCEQKPSVSTPEPLAGPGAGVVPPALHVVADNLALPVPSPELDTAPQAETVPDRDESGNLWALALGSLSEKDKNTLDAKQIGSKIDIEELLAAAREKREMCLKSQWEFEFRGQAINLRYQADKIISWLAKFKEVGDIAIQYDPGHAALPWAGIRFLLQVGPAHQPFPIFGTHRSLDVYSGARSDGVTSHGIGKINEHHQPMQNLRDPLPRWNSKQGNRKCHEAGIGAPEGDVNFIVHGGATLACEGLPGV